MTSHLTTSHISWPHISHLISHILTLPNHPSVCQKSCGRQELQGEQCVQMRPLTATVKPRQTQRGPFNGSQILSHCVPSLWNWILRVCATHIISSKIDWILQNQQVQHSTVLIRFNQPWPQATSRISWGQPRTDQSLQPRTLVSCQVQIRTHKSTWSRLQVSEMKTRRNYSFTEKLRCCKGSSTIISWECTNANRHRYTKPTCAKAWTHLTKLLPGVHIVQTTPGICLLLGRSSDASRLEILMSPSTRGREVEKRLHSLCSETPSHTTSKGSPAESESWWR